MKKAILTAFAAAMLVCAASAHGDVGSLEIRPGVPPGMEDAVLTVRTYDVGVYDGVRGGYVLDPVFARYGVDSAGPDLADALWTYFRRDGVAARGIYETRGSDAINLDNLAPGLYLITGDVFRSGGMKYVPEPVLVDVVPGGEAIICNLGVVPATVTDRVSVSAAFDGCEVPESVTAELLLDGKPFESQVLSAVNGWTHTWTDLNPAGAWTVACIVPDGLSVSMGGSRIYRELTFRQAVTGESPAAAVTMTDAARRHAKPADAKPMGTAQVVMPDVAGPEAAGPVAGFLDGYFTRAGVEFFGLVTVLLAAAGLAVTYRRNYM